jgi:hypothetical protein
VRVALAVVAEEVVEAVLQRAARRVEHAHPPFAHAAGGVPCVLEQPRHGERPGRQRHLAFRLNLAVRADGRMARM